jgi:hypothetical protein
MGSKQNELVIKTIDKWAHRRTIGVNRLSHNRRVLWVGEQTCDCECIKWNNRADGTREQVDCQPTSSWTDSSESLIYKANQFESCSFRVFKSLCLIGILL